MNERYFKAAKGFVFYEGKVLLLRESGSYKDGANSGLFDVPGGRLEPEEDERKALIRDTREETGLTISIRRKLDYKTRWNPVVREEQWHIDANFFICDSNSKLVKLSEDHDHHLWIPPENFRIYPVIFNLVPVFEHLLEYLKR